ncbi:MAG: ABC transporter substrate-binding protein [Corynebacterium sp.]|uniref:ABC transporter substrate-binding protein n=1 Tax=Corynebacterium sp. TaxID=1720 RepID=UPI003F96C384
MRKMSVHHLLSAVAALVLGGSFLVACGDGSGDSGGAGDPDLPDSVTVSHAMGETDVPTNPGTVVSVSTAFTDAFAALGSPVSLEARPSLMEDGAPWNGDNDDAEADETVTYDGASATLADDLSEQFAALDPDVIFAGWLPDEEAYEKLSAIAPTVGVVGDNTQSDDWREATSLAGELLGEDDEASSLIQDVEDRVADTTATYPGLEGATAVFGQISAQGTAVVTADNDPANRFLTDLGMVVPDEVKEASDDGSRAFISEENVHLLDTDFLAMWPYGVEPDTLSGWDDLTSVRNGSAFVIGDQADSMALSTPTVRSIPWSLEKLDPNFRIIDENR